MKLIYKNKARNFTGDDLARAEATVASAQASYDNAKKGYDYSLSVGHDSYAKRVRKPEMDTAYEQLSRAKDTYDGILKSIKDANDAAYAQAQQAAVENG